MSASAEGSESDPNLTPLLDVVLQLIMFFMITVNFVRVENLTDKVVLPVAQSAIPQEDSGEDWVYLNIGKDGKILMKPQDIGLEDEEGRKQFRVFLRQRTEEIEAKARQRGHQGELRITVIISAHEDARAQQVWSILNACEKAGFKRWKIRALTRSLSGEEFK